MFFTDETDNIRKHFGVSKDDAERDIEIIKNWYKQQLHLPKAIPDDNFIEKFLMRSKYRLEIAKKYIDSYYTLRGIYPEFWDFDDFHFTSERYAYYPLGRTKNFERIVLGTRTKTNEHFDTLNYAQSLLLCSEILNRYDTNTGCIFINIFSDFDVSDYKRLLPGKMLTAMNLFFNVYPCRIRDIYVFNAPSYIGVVMNLVKPAFKAKIFQRIRLLKEDELYSYIDRDYFPKEYEGSYKSLEEIRDDMNDWLNKNRKFLKELQTLVSDENLRVGGALYTKDIFGSEGTFKKINLD